MPIDCIFGTRPEAVKLLPAVLALRARGVRVRLVFTAQHAAMAADVFSAFSVYPDITLPSSAKTDMAARLGDRLTALTAALGEREENETDITDAADETDKAADGTSAVLVQGDTLSALVGGLYGFLSGRRVLHLEAGLRTHVPRSPYPEEAVRRALAAMADLHLATTPFAVQNLLREGVPRAAIRLVGNTVEDAMEALLPTAVPYPKARGLYLWLLTLHRRECDSDTRRAMLTAVRDLLDEYPACELLLPVHPSPAVGCDVRAVLGRHARAHLTPPMPPSAFYGALTAADLILTDSGGVQEEACVLGRHPLVLREVTEREEELYGGRLTLVGTSPVRIKAAVRARMRDVLSRQGVTQPSPAAPRSQANAPKGGGSLQADRAASPADRAASPADRAAEEIIRFLQA